MKSLREIPSMRFIGAHLTDTIIFSHAFQFLFKNKYYDHSQLKLPSVAHAVEDQDEDDDDDDDDVAYDDSHYCHEVVEIEDVELPNIMLQLL
ncbi:unnamed protein product [Ceratitis capitata]|uniref:(Mediterranean fruit fly) hypothetical protein n=1 Tax=Ceratitis capitata TaxID=7213 RepID=A0A811V8Z0_CERCA|nr:unnamed protein product [Ceratitis capitata]